MGNSESMESDCRYDSTWDDEDDDEGGWFKKNKIISQPQRTLHRNMRAAKDMQNYRHMYRRLSEMTPPVREHESFNYQSTEYNQMRRRDRAYSEPSTSQGCCNFELSNPLRSQTRKRRHEETRADVIVRQPVASHDRREELLNLKFYQNKFKSRPDGVYIDDFHKSWRGDYDRLERVHSYIQWLFPTQEQGVNQTAPVLTPKEIKLFRDDTEAKSRLLESYKLMLDFYGICLLDDRTGTVTRGYNWKERFDNMNRNTHNNLRITRILKCLGLLGFERFQAPLVHFFLKETLKERNLPRVKQSVLDYFLFAVLDKNERKGLITYAFKIFQPKEEFVWCPRRIQTKLEKHLSHRKEEKKMNVHAQSRNCGQGYKTFSTNTQPNMRFNGREENSSNEAAGPSPKKFKFHT